MKHNRQSRRHFLFALLLVLPGCISQSQIQSQYINQQDTCRMEASKKLSGNPAASTSEGQSSAGIYFSECMNKAGWRVSMPKPASTQTAQGQNPPSGAPSTNPSAATAAPVPMQQPAQPAPVQPPVAQQQAGTYPPSGAPSVNPSAAAARVNPAPQPAQGQNPGEAPAQYLPRPQVNSGDNQKGYGPARQF